MEIRQCVLCLLHPPELPVVVVVVYVAVVGVRASADEEDVS